MDSKVIVISGASSGIGEATASNLAERGAKLVLAARGEEKLLSVADKINKAGGQAVPVSMDVSTRADWTKVIEAAQVHYGRLDVLVSSAGAMPIGPVGDLAVDDWEQMVNVNLLGMLYGVAAALPIFRQQAQGHFVNIASTAARKTTPNQAIYSATKAAVLAFSDGLRQELAGKLRVTVISPGVTDTHFAEHIRDETLRSKMKEVAEDYAMAPAAVAAAIAYAIEQPNEINIGEIVLRSTAQP